LGGGAVLPRVFAQPETSQREGANRKRFKKPRHGTPSRARRKKRRLWGKLWSAGNALPDRHAAKGNKETGRRAGKLITSRAGRFWAREGS